MAQASGVEHKPTAAHSPSLRVAVTLVIQLIDPWADARPSEEYAAPDIGGTREIVYEGCLYLPPPSFVGHGREVRVQDVTRFAQDCAAAQLRAIPQASCCGTSAYHILPWTGRNSDTLPGLEDDPVVFCYQDLKDFLVIDESLHLANPYLAGDAFTSHADSTGLRTLSFFCRFQVAMDYRDIWRGSLWIAPGPREFGPWVCVPPGESAIQRLRSDGLPSIPIPRLPHVHSSINLQYIERITMAGILQIAQKHDVELNPDTIDL